MLHRLAILGILTALLAVAAPAAAQTSSVQDGYGGRPAADTDVLGEIGSVDEETPSTAPAAQNNDTPAPAPQAAAVPAAAPQLSESSLPFTGTDAALLAAGGMALLASGLVMRRVARERA